MLPTLETDSSVRKALAILDCYRTGARELGVSELARRTRMAKSTVHRLCMHLVDAGYLAKTDRRAFSLTLGVFELGSVALAPYSAGQDASRFLQQLSVLTGETSHLAILDGGDVVYVDKIETLQSEKVPSRVGQRNPAHCTALGKVMLAWNPAACEQLPLVDGRLRAFTPHTITSPAVLRQELATVHATGVAYDHEERNLGIRCVAAPVRNHVGAVIAAISVCGPTGRMTEERLTQVAHVVRQASAGLSRQLGWRGASHLRGVADAAS